MVTLYSNGCPRCKILEQKLTEKNIQFEKLDDVQYLIENGFKAYPVLKTKDGELLDFGKANKYINDLEG